MEDISPSILESMFTGPSMKGRFPHTSCSLKHMLAYGEIIRQKLDGALVLEDDICLHNNFNEVFNQSMNELTANPALATTPVIISYEDTRLRFVPRSKRVKGKVLYPGDRDRMAGAYYINQSAAKMITEYVNQHKMDVPIDILHRKLLEAGKLTYLWCHPTIATQGSHNGMHKSGINLKKSSLTPLKWLIERLYKKMLYWFR